MSSDELELDERLQALRDEDGDVRDDVEARDAFGVALEMQSEKAALAAENAKLKRRLDSMRGGAAASDEEDEEEDEEDEGDEEDEDTDGDGERPRKSQKKKGNSDAAVDRRVLRVRRLAKKAVIMGSVWPPSIPGDNVDVSDDNPLEVALKSSFLADAPDPETRYDGYDKRMLTYRYEICSVFGEKILDDHGEDLWFFAEVRDAMNDRRSTAANRVRKTCAATIFPRELLLRSWGERKLLLGYKEPAEGEMSCSWEPLDARILHDGSDGEWEDNGSEFNPATFMRGDEPQLTGSCLIYGPSGATALALGKKFPPTGGRKREAVLWHLTQATVGFISISGILTIFALSEDTKFTPIGDITRIPYQRYYEEYSQYLHAGLKSGDPHVKALFDAWNARLFPHVTAKNATSGPSASLQRALKSIQQPMDSAESSNPPGEAAVTA